MTWQPSKQTLEDAALAVGLSYHGIYLSQKDDGICDDIGLDIGEVDCILWQPNLPTTQGKADLQDLQLALPTEALWFFDRQGNYKSVYVSYHDGDTKFGAEIDIINNDKHAALARAALEVAAQVGAKMRKSKKTTLDNLLAGRPKIPLKASDIGAPSFLQDVKGGA